LLQVFFGATGLKTFGVKMLFDELWDAQENKVPISNFPCGALLRVGGASP
jgi:hypothetical protein